MSHAPAVQTVSANFFQQPLSEVHYRHFISCPPDTSASAAARLMREHQQSAILVEDDKGDFQGIFTDKDIRNRILAANVDPNVPVKEVMSSPLATIRYDETIFEALFFMNRKGYMHLAVINDEGRVIGLIRYHRLIAKGFSPFYMLQEIEKTTSVNRLKELHEQIPSVVTTLLEGRTSVRRVAGLVSLFADAVLEQLLQRAVEEADLGAPPCRFVFMAMGSEGRQEQTLKTDQDNAIIFEDVPPEEFEATQLYFLRLGEWVCTRLDRIGYTLCHGNIMAMNPKWCQPVSRWKEYFTHWILRPEPQAMLEASIFFDFRPEFGDFSLTNELREHLFQQLNDRRAKLFYLHMTRNAQNMAVPLNWLGRLSLERKGEHAHTFDLKKAMTPFVDFARLKCLDSRIVASSTLDRLERLREEGILKEEEFQEMYESYRFLLRLRFTHQVRLIKAGKPPENYLNPEECSPLDQKMIVETLNVAKQCQSRLRSQFAPMDR
jgi:CBS domain-containing protein